MVVKGAQIAIVPIYRGRYISQLYRYAGAGGFHNEHCDKENRYVCKKQSGATQPIPPTTTKEPPENSYCPIGYTAIDPKQEPNMGKCTDYTRWRHQMETVVA